MGTKGARKWGRRDAEHREGKGSQPIYRGRRRVRNRAVLPDAPILPLTTEQQRSVRCPRCLAKPGDPCRSQTGRIVAGGHADRRWTARRVHRRRLIGSTPLQVRDIDYQKARKTGGAVDPEPAGNGGANLNQRRRKAAREPRGGVGPAAVARAEEEMRRSRESIEATSRGTPAGRTSNYSRGKTPGSNRKA
jgi:hypothetical protein